MLPDIPGLIMADVSRNRLPEISFGQLLYRLIEPQRKIVRDFEKLIRRIVRSSYGMMFNITCLDENILPKYTDIGTAEPGVKYEDCTLRFRRDVLIRNLNKFESECKTVTDQMGETGNRVAKVLGESELLAPIKQKLDEIRNAAEGEASQRIIRKLNNLYGGTVLIPENCEPFVNLTEYELNEEQKELLSLGTKFHYKKKVYPLVKKVETELLYEAMLRLAEKDHVVINDNLETQLLAEATKIRDFSYSQVITRKLRAAAKDFEQQENFIIRKADKSSCFVIMERETYKEKLDIILSDESKFSMLSRNPTTELKVEINKFIKSANEQSKQALFKPVGGEFRPGYIYRTVKTHKEGNPLRPIASQIPTPTYETAKILTKLIRPCLPARFQIDSTYQNGQMLRVSNVSGELASIDVEH